MPRPVTGVGRGGKSTPTEVKRLRGNPGKRKLPVAGEALVVVGLDEIPKPPKGLGAVGVAVWNALWSAGRRHLAEGHDSVMVGLVCRGLNQIDVLENWLGDDVERRWYVTANGQTVTHPAVKQIEVLHAQVTGWLSVLGFSPSDRARLGLTEIKTRNELDTWRERNEKPVKVKVVEVGEPVDQW